MKQKWYLQTWFIAFLFAFWFFIIPGIVGLILLIKQYTFIKEVDSICSTIGGYDQMMLNILNLEKEYESKKDSLEETHQKKINSLNGQYKEKENELRKIKAEIKSLEADLVIQHYDFSDYDGLSSEECKNKLSLLKQDEQSTIKEGTIVQVSSSGTKKEINSNIKQIIRCFNSECDNVFVNLSVKNIDTSRKKITSSFESLNRIFEVDGLQLNKRLLEMKLEELNLVYTYELKKEQEREQQKAIKEQMVEEEKVRREIEKQKKKIEKDQNQCSGEIKKLMGYMQKTKNDVEKQLYIDKITELESKLKELESEKDTVHEREANATAGFVYVISNIGSFGEDVYKIGMTRRLEPMDRIKELSSASVPFEFDVHAMIFSGNAPELETTLHRHFKEHSINKVNPRKEFFKVTIDEIEKVVIQNFNNTVEFTKIPVAKDYNDSLRIAAAQ